MSRVVFTSEGKAVRVADKGGIITFDHKADFLALPREERAKYNGQLIRFLDDEKNRADEIEEIKSDIVEIEQTLENTFDKKGVGSNDFRKIGDMKFGQFALSRSGQLNAWGFTKICDIPSGYAPQRSVRFPLASQSNDIPSYVVLVVGNDGTVVIENQSGTALTRDYVLFPMCVSWI